MRPLCPVLIGRVDQVAVADGLLAAARTGAGHVLLLSGEAGIGKSRLMAEVCGRAAGQGFTAFVVGAYPRDAEVAGGVLVGLAAALRRAAHPAAGRLAGRLLDGVRGDDAGRQRRLLAGDLADAIVSVGADAGPVLLVLEDLQWADDLTLEVLDRVAGRLAGVPMLLAGTYRSDELYPRVPLRAWRARLLTQRLAEEVRLPRLGPDDTAAMMAAISDKVLPATLTTAVYERSDGIPLHVEEFLASFARPDAAWRGVPDTLADAVLTRAETLSPAARALAEAASTIGRSFDLDVLTAITDAGPAAVDAGLRELEDRFFVQPFGGDATTYDFRHALMRDALYAGLSPHRCRELHARVAAAAVEAGFGGAFISDQYERAHQPAEAFRYALAAARESVALSAHREAVQLYRRAQRTTPAAVPDAERADLLAELAGELAAIDDNAGAAAAFAQAAAIRRRLGDHLGAAQLVPAHVAARHLLGADFDDLDRQLRDALTLVETDRYAAENRAAGQEARVRILAGLASVYMLDICLDDAVEFGRRAQALAADLGALATRLNSGVTLGAALVFAGRMDEGWDLLETTTGDAQTARMESEAARGYRMLGSTASVLVEYERAGRWLSSGIAYAERTERFNDRYYMAAHRAHTYWATGDWPAAEREARHALVDGRGGITTRITALHVLGYLALGRADWAGAERMLQEARELGTQMNELRRLSPSLCGLAETALHSGRVSDAVEWCERGYTASEPAWDAAYLFPYVVTGTRAYLALDDPSSARKWLDRCAELIRYRGIPGTLPALDHAQGLLHLAGGHTGKARAALERASTAWDARHRFWEGTQALLDRAHAARRSRRPHEATALAAEARDRAERTGAAALLTLGDRLPTETSPHGTPHPLTAREIEVARLVATGATNRQIAAALSISPKTVAAHIEHILAKLGAARRTEIAAWATANTAATTGR